MYIMLHFYTILFPICIYRVLIYFWGGYPKCDKTHLTTKAYTIWGRKCKTALVHWKKSTTLNWNYMILTEMLPKDISVNFSATKNLSAQKKSRTYRDFKRLGTAHINWECALCMDTISSWLKSQVFDELA